MIDMGFMESVTEQSRWTFTCRAGRQRRSTSLVWKCVLFVWGSGCWSDVCFLLYFPVLLFKSSFVYVLHVMMAEQHAASQTEFNLSCWLQIPGASKLLFSLTSLLKKNKTHVLLSIFSVFFLFHRGCNIMLALQGLHEQTNTGINGMYQHIMQDLLSTVSLNYSPTQLKLHMAKRLAHSHCMYTHCCYCILRSVDTILYFYRGKTYLSQHLRNCRH